jgi:hypothetical protein
VGSANKKTQLKSTRQSSRLRKQGGVPVEELATRRKKKLNIEEHVLLLITLLLFLILLMMRC